jgi:prevent-host-death family protein
VHFVATTISQRELRNDNADIMRRVEQGETFVVTRNGTPVADLTPHLSAERQRFMPVADLAAGLEAIGDWGVDAFAGERRLLDEVFDDADRDPWVPRPAERG